MKIENLKTGQILEMKNGMVYTKINDIPGIIITSNEKLYFISSHPSLGVSNIQLDEWVINYRQTGKTTRLADECIQMFFNKEEAICIDHHYTKAANQNLMLIVYNRLINEHGFTHDILLCNPDTHKIIARKNFKG